jgi:AraC-like DNA-binding protein
MAAGDAVPAIRAWNPRVAGIREVFHARFADHAYPPHTHDVWTLFIVDEGAIRYDLHGRPHVAERSMVSILPPHVVHDGRPAMDGGFRKRVLYLEADVLGEGLVGAAVDRPVVPGEDLRGSVSRLHDALACADDALEAESRLASLTDRIAAALGRPAAPPPGTGAPAAAEQLRAFLDAHLFEAITLASVATALGATTTQLARAFTATFGIPPHAYVLGRRLEVARDRILDGQALADVAADTGFCDQAHLTRRFRQLLGTTPGRFRASPAPVRARPAPARASRAKPRRLRDAGRPVSVTDARGDS